MTVTKFLTGRGERGEKEGGNVLRTNAALLVIGTLVAYSTEVDVSATLPVTAALLRLERSAPLALRGGAGRGGLLGREGRGGRGLGTSIFSVGLAVLARFRGVAEQATDATFIGEWELTSVLSPNDMELQVAADGDWEPW